MKPLPSLSSSSFSSPSSSSPHNKASNKLNDAPVSAGEGSGGGGCTDSGGGVSGYVDPTRNNCDKRVDDNNTEKPSRKLTK